MGNDKTIDNIKKGKGLDPLPSNQPFKETGITQEQRGKPSGIRRDTFTKNGSKKEK